MKVFTGRVSGGKIELGAEVADGTPVAVLAPDPEAPQLSAEEERELSEALAEIQRGEFEDGFALLREIKAQAGR